MNKTLWKPAMQPAPESISFEGMQASADVRGLMLEMKMEQRFRNTSNAHVEMIYTFPLPWDAVLLGVLAKLGDKQMAGFVTERTKAEVRYERAIVKGDSAIMIEKNADFSYTINLGNLAPQESCVVTLYYSQVLTFEQRGLRLQIPTVIAPRYGDGSVSHSNNLRQMTDASLHADYPFDISVRLHGELAQSRVASPSHALRFSSAEGSLHISLARKGALDRDFVLVIDQIQQDALAVAVPDPKNPGTKIVQLSFCPHLPAAASSQASVKILVDCSGSMAGDSIAAAKRALSGIVRQFTAGDRFSLSQFGSTVTHCGRHLWPSTASTRMEAQRWVTGLNADLGGTRMKEALQSVFRLQSCGAMAQTDTCHDVLMVTDGEIEAIEDTIDIARASNHRLFIVGIGSSPAGSHLRRLAEATGGICDFVAPGEDVEPAVLRMFARLRSPRLEDVRIVWPEGVTPGWCTVLPKSIFDADTVNVFAALPRRAEGDIRLEGRSPDGEEMQVISTVALPCKTPELQPNAIEAVHALARCATFVRIRQAEQGISREKIDFVQLAVDYQIISEGTNILLTLRRSANEKAPAMPVLQAVPQMLAAGWRGAGTVTGHEEDPPAFLRMQPNFDSDAEPCLSLDSDDESFDIPPRTPLKPVHRDPLNAFELAILLRSTQPAEWPKSIVELDTLRLTSTLRSLREVCIIAIGDDLHLEQSYVEAFLNALIYLVELELSKAGERTRNRSAFSALRDPDPSLLNNGLVGQMIAELKGMDAASLLTT